MLPRYHRGLLAAPAAHVLPVPGGRRVVLVPLVVRVEELLEPLQELEVVLELALHQFVYRDYLAGKKQAEIKDMQRQRRAR